MSGRASSSSLSPLRRSSGRRNRSPSPKSTTRRYGRRGRSPSFSPKSPNRRYDKRGRSPSTSPKSPSPSRRYGRRGRSLSPGSHRHELTTLFVRNLSYDCRADDLREAYRKFGPLKNVYIPQNFHTRKPQRFGFVNFMREADAAEAKCRTDGKKFFGRRLSVLLTREKRRTPDEMREREIVRTGRCVAFMSPNCSSLSISPPRCRRSCSRGRRESSCLFRSASPEDDRRKTCRNLSRFSVLSGSRSRSRSR